MEYVKIGKNPLAWGGCTFPVFSVAGAFARKIQGRWEATYVSRQRVPQVGYGRTAGRSIRQLRRMVGAERGPVVDPKIDTDFVEAAKRVFNPQAFASYMAGEWGGFTEADCEMLSEEASVVAAERLEATQ